MAWSRKTSGPPRLAVGATLSFAIPVYVFLLFNDGMRHSARLGRRGLLLWCGWSLTKGLVPYRDFMEFKPPFVFLTYALALKLYGFEPSGSGPSSPTSRWPRPRSASVC